MSVSSAWLLLQGTVWANTLGLRVASLQLRPQGMYCSGKQGLDTSAYEKAAEQSCS